MRKIILTTESGADLPESVANQYGIHVVPMHVIMEGKDYLDGTLPVEEIYGYYQRTKKIPSTTSTNAHEYEEMFTKVRSLYPDCLIFHIGYTSKASSSFQNAILAAREFNDIYLIDALNVTGGLGAIVLYAARLLEEQPHIEPALLVERIEAMVPKCKLAFVPGSLEFLRAGGRVSNAAYLGGSLLQIKPCIELLDGKLTSTKKYRGKMASVTEKLMRDYLTMYDIDRQQLYFIYSIGLDESIKQRMDLMAEEAGFTEVKWIQAGSMISTHSGPGGFGIAGFENMEEMA